MPDILHRIGVAAPPQSVYDVLTTTDGVAGWWTDVAHGDAGGGGTIELRFGDDALGVRVVELDPASRVVWEVTSGPAEWIGTLISWDLRAAGDQTTILFAHRHWREPNEFMHHCSTKWATFLMSRRSLIESGRGAPFPRDVKVGNWG
jgi:uncharacterized protein YndB with AHSA1/START domain